jgi:nicotinate phosphoribosyltransferase
VASSDLDPETISSLREQGAKIDTWGVGTRLVTAYEQPALGGVYKLAAVRRDAEEDWRMTVKISADPEKTTVPGILGARRFYDQAGRASADMIYDTVAAVEPGGVVVDPVNARRRKSIDRSWRQEELLVPILRGGDLVTDLPDLATSRARAQEQLASFHPGVLRRLNPHRYPAGLDVGLHRRRESLVEAALERRTV